MRASNGSQKLPASGPKREALRQKGQFWTPDWVAQAMVAYCVAGGGDSIFDPAVGAGAFFRAAETLETGPKTRKAARLSSLFRAWFPSVVNGGADGTRTRDLRRDRPAF